MSVKIYSTLSSHQIYTFWELPLPGGMPKIKKEVTIQGGANIATKQLVTPLGVMTEVSDEDYASLQGNHVFNRHLEGGFIQVRKQKVDPEVAVADMTRRDDSAPVTPETAEAMLGGIGVKPMADSAKDAPIKGNKKRDA